MADIKITQQMIDFYRNKPGNSVLLDSAIIDLINKDIKTGKLPKEFALLATDVQKAVYNANTSNLFGFGFNTSTGMGLSFERTTPKTNQNEQQAKKIASSVKENSRWYKDWGGSSLVAECKKTTKDNILYTLKEFEKISPDKNLVLTITDNSTISVEKQKEALKHIFNVLCNLAKDKGVDTIHFEKAFKTNISQTRTETRISSTGMPSGTYTKEVLTDSNITTINNIIVGLRNSIDVKANPNVYNQIALALTPEEQIQEQTIGSLKYKRSSSLEALENQNRYDGWAGELADWMSGAWGSKNREKHVRADLVKFNKQITELEDAKKVSKEAFEKKFEEIFGTKYDAELIVNYQQVEQLYQIATSCYQLEQFFKSDLNVLLSNSTLREETKTVSIDPMTSLTQTTVLATKKQVFEREFNKLANFVGQGNLENGKQQLEEVFKASGLTETSTLQEKYTVLRQVAQNYAKSLHDNTMQVTGNKGYEAIAKDFDDAYKSAFGVTNDIARRVAEYNVSQQAGAGVIKSTVMIGGTIALGAVTGGAGLSFFPALAITSVGAGAITATTEFSDRLSSGYVIEGFKENGIEGAIEGAKQALPDEEIIRILKSTGITTLAVAAGGLLGAGVEIGAQALKMSILTKSIAHVAVGTGVGAGAEYLHTGTVSVQGVIFAFVLSAVGQVIAITKVGTMDNGKVTFDKQAIQQARQDLGLADDVVLTEAVLKKAYRKMSIQTHPDKGGTAEAFVKVKTAYDLLMQYAQPATATGVKSSSSQTTTKSNTATSTQATPNLPSKVNEPLVVQTHPQKTYMHEEVIATNSPKSVTEIVIPHESQRSFDALKKILPEIEETTIAKMTLELDRAKRELGIEPSGALRLDLSSSKFVEEKIRLGDDGHIRIKDSNDFVFKFNPKSGELISFSSEQTAINIKKALAVSADVRNTTSQYGTKSATNMEICVNKLDNTEISHQEFRSGRVNGQFEIYSIDPNGKRYLVGLAERSPNGDCYIEKTLVSLDGTKTDYVFRSDAKGSRFLYQKITNKDGGVEYEVTKKHRVISENRFITSENDQHFEIEISDNKLKVTKLDSNQNKTSEVIEYDIMDLSNTSIKDIDFNKEYQTTEAKMDAYFEALGIQGKRYVIDKRLLPSLKDFSGDQWFKLYNSNTRLLYGECEIEGNASSAGGMITISEKVSSKVSTAHHEGGHEMFNALNLADDAKLREIYEAEKEAYTAMFPDDLISPIAYFLRGNENSLRGINELVAETNLIINIPQTDNAWGARTALLQQYFPKSIAYIAKELNKLGQATPIPSSNITTQNYAYLPNEAITRQNRINSIHVGSLNMKEAGIVEKIKTSLSLYLQKTGISADLPSDIIFDYANDTQGRPVKNANRIMFSMSNGILRVNRYFLENIDTTIKEGLETYVKEGVIKQSKNGEYQLYEGIKNGRILDIERKCNSLSSLSLTEKFDFMVELAYVRDISSQISKYPDVTINNILKDNNAVRILKANNLYKSESKIANMTKAQQAEYLREITKFVDIPSNTVLENYSARLVIHEQGHLEHRKNFTEAEWKDLHEDVMIFKMMPHMQRTASKVSSYAMESPTEFVAEVYSGLINGQKFDADVMGMYEMYKGPKVENLINN